MAAFGQALPTIRQRVQQDLNLPGLPKNKVLATVVRLIDKTAIRVGNDEYAKTNESFGATTMREDHVDIVNGSKLRFRFRGKSGIEHEIEVTDKKLAKIVQQCQELPGEELFHYINDDGDICRIYSEDVNAYLRELSGQDFTAKDFRTWVGTSQAALELESIGPCETQTDAKKNLTAMVKAVSQRLGNKPPACRKYYIHPIIFESYVSGSLLESMKSPSEPDSPEGLRREELCVLELVLKHVPQTVTVAA
jgi:DNA topoisomerase-1